jgi:cobalt-zinc-cadmium resistance protein CzcA
MVSGVRSQVAIKLFGDDLGVLKEKGDAIARVLSSIGGSTDLRVEKVSGQEYLTVKIDRAAIARFGINVEDVNDMIEIAIKGRDATLVYEGERRYNAVVRFPEAYRNNIEAISGILLTAPSGAVVPLKDLADITLADGPAQVSRESAKRRLVIGANVQGRDLGGFVEEVQRRMDSDLKPRLPTGVVLEYSGEFEDLIRAGKTLRMIVPVSLVVIFLLLFIAYHDAIEAAHVILASRRATAPGVACER